MKLFQFYERRYALTKTFYTAIFETELSFYLLIEYDISQTALNI